MLDSENYSLEDSADDETISRDDYIKSSIEAGNRVRGIVYVMIFASIIAFIYYWNASKTSWINDRFQTAFEADEHYSANANPNNLLSKVACKNYKLDSARISAFLNNYEINTPAKLETYKKIFSDLRETTFSVKVPILGVTFDINDLSLFSGLTFFFLLLILRLSIEREKENVSITFNYAERIGRLVKIYNYLAMGQVLSDPPKLVPRTVIIKKGPKQRRLQLFLHNGKQTLLRKHLAKVLFLIPLITHGIIIRNDISTIFAGNALSPYSTNTVLYSSCFIFILNAVLAGMCIYIKATIDTIWEYYHSEILDLKIANNNSVE